MMALAVEMAKVDKQQKAEEMIGLLEEAKANTGDVGSDAVEPRGAAADPSGVAGAEPLAPASSPGVGRRDGGTEQTSSHSGGITPVRHHPQQQRRHSRATPRVSSSGLPLGPSKYRRPSGSGGLIGEPERISRGGVVSADEDDDERNARSSRRQPSVFELIGAGVGVDSDAPGARRSIQGGGFVYFAARAL